MNLTKSILGVGLGLLIAGGAVAMPVEVRDITGASDFYLVYDDEEAGLFGTPTLRNNTIFFVPSGFVATSNNGAGLVDTFSTIQLSLIAETPGFTFDQFILQERGDYRLIGSDAWVDVDGRMQVFDPNDSFNFASTDIVADMPLTNASGRLEDWTASAAITGWASGVREVNMTLENLLTAFTSEFGSGAFIEKKFEGVRVQVNPVPLPAALWLLAPALLALGRRRKS